MKNTVRLLAYLANIALVVGIAHLFGATRDTIGPYGAAVAAAGLALVIAEEEIIERALGRHADDRKRRSRISVVASSIIAIVAIGLFFWTRSEQEVQAQRAQQQQRDSRQTHEFEKNSAAGIDTYRKISQQRAAATQQVSN